MALRLIKVMVIGVSEIRDCEVDRYPGIERVVLDDRFARIILTLKNRGSA